MNEQIRQAAKKPLFAWIASVAVPTSMRGSVGLLALGLAALEATAPAVAAQPADFREKFLDHIELDTSVHGKAYVGEILKGPVYEVDFEAFEGHGHYRTGSSVSVFENDEGSLIPVFIPTTSEPLPYFEELIIAEFRLTRENAGAFQAILKAIMPEDFFEEVDGEATRSRNGEWHFLTGSFFDRQKGFVVTTDAEGRVESVSYSLEL